MIMITPAEFEDEMKDAVKRKDNDIAIHLMCEALIDNGYERGVKIFLDAANSR